MMADYPVGIRLYDLLFDGAEDCARCPSMRGAGGWRPGMRARAPRGWTCRR